MKKQDYTHSYAEFLSVDLSPGAEKLCGCEYELHYLPHRTRPTMPMHARNTNKSSTRAPMLNVALDSPRLLQ